MLKYLDCYTQNRPNFLIVDYFYDCFLVCLFDLICRIFFWCWRILCNFGNPLLECQQLPVQTLPDPKGNYLNYVKSFDVKNKILKMKIPQVKEISRDIFEGLKVIWKIFKILLFNQENSYKVDPGLFSQKSCFWRWRISRNFAALDPKGDW